MSDLSAHWKLVRGDDQRQAPLMTDDQSGATSAGLLALVPVPAAIVDRDDLSLVAVNTPLCDLLGVRPATLVGRSIGELLPAGRARVVVDVATSVTTAARGLDVTLALGGRDLHGRLTLAPGPTPGTLLLVYADHTALHRETSDLRAALSALSSAKTNVGHEIQAELTVVAGYSRMLATAGERITPQERARLHERVAASAQRAAGLSRELRSGRVPTARDAATLQDVLAWVEQATALRLQETEAVLVWDVDGDVAVDTGVLRQVLVRLVDDALRRDAGGGPRHVHVAMHPAAAGLEVVVSDSTDGGPDGLDQLTDGGTPTDAPTLQVERAMATHVGGLLSSVPTADGTRHVLWLPRVD